MNLEADEVSIKSSVFTTNIFQADLEEMLEEGRIADERAKKAMIDAAR